MSACRVAIDATPLLGHRTGIGVYCAGLLGALVERDELELWAYAVSWRRRRGIAELLPPGVRRVDRPMPARPLHWAWRHGNRPIAERLVGPTDVVHGTNYVVPPTGRAAAVVSIYDLTVIRYPELCDPATLAYPNLIRRALDRGAVVHTLSRYVADEVVETFGVPAERVHAVLAGVPTLADEGPTGLRGVVPVPGLPASCSRYVLAVGTVEPRKDLPGLVRAFAALSGRHPETALVLAGQPGWGSDALDAAIGAVADPVIRGRIVRTGWLDDRTLDGILRGARVLAYPSRYEGFGFPPLQAMAAGVPVVATSAGSLPEVLGGAADLVPPGDIDSLGGALDRLLSDDGVGDDLTRRGRARVAELSWARCAEGMVDLYIAAAGSRIGRR